MKLIYTIAILFVFYNIGLANVWQGDYFINSQSQANRFKSTTITGDLYIQGGNTIHLDSLHHLELVNGTVRIFISENLNNIDGLRNLKTIEKELYIRYNQNLEIINGFDQLTTVKEGIRISGNPLLKINGFNNLSYTTSIDISNKVTISELTGFNSIDSLINLNISCDVNTFDAFHSLKMVSRSLEIYANFNDTFSAFEALEEVKRRFSIKTNLTSKQLAVFDKLQKVDYFSFSNSSIEELHAFNNLKSVNVLDIYGCESLKKINGFTNLKQINLLEIYCNPQLNSISAFNKFGRIDVIYIANNTNLQSLDGFENLKSAKYITVSVNNNLLKLSTFNQVSRVDAIHIESRNLRNLDAFHKLKSVGNLTLLDNLQLRSIDSFAELSHVGDQVVLENNSQLNQCCIVNCWLKNEVLTESQLVLDSNEEACSTIEAIKTNCMDIKACPIIKDELTDLNIMTNPPIEESLSFNFISTLTQKIAYSIYNINGQMLQQGGLSIGAGLNNKTIPLEHSLLKGYYFLSIDDERSLQTARFIKL